MSEIIYEDGFEREASEQELLQFKKDKEESEKSLNLISDRKQARDSALAKLAALGLTEEEIAAL
jgi:hypothetical protein